MISILQDGVSKGHGNLVRFVGTTQKESSMFRGYQGNPWRVCARIFLLAMVSFVVCPTMTETFGSSQVFSKQHVSAESQCLSPYRVFLISERASSSMVGTIMSLLSTFDEAGVLPPE